MTAVRDEVAHHGVALRAGGDEVNVITTGLDRDRVADLAERRTRVAALRVEHEGRELPRVTTSIGFAVTPPASRTASIGFAVTPPASRTRALVDVADRAQIVAKKGRKNCVHDGSEK